MYFRRTYGELLYSLAGNKCRVGLLTDYSAPVLAAIEGQSRLPLEICSIVFAYLKFYDYPSGLLCLPKFGSTFVVQSSDSPLPNGVLEQVGCLCIRSHCPSRQDIPSRRHDT